MIDSEEVVLLRDKRQRVDSKKTARAAARKKQKLGGLAARTKSKGNEIKVIYLGKELEEFRLPEGYS